MWSARIAAAAAAMKRRNQLERLKRVLGRKNLSRMKAVHREDPEAIPRLIRTAWDEIKEIRQDEAQLTRRIRIRSAATASRQMPLF